MQSGWFGHAVADGGFTNARQLPCRCLAAFQGIGRSRSPDSYVGRRNGEAVPTYAHYERRSRKPNRRRSGHRTSSLSRSLRLFDRIRHSQWNERGSLPELRVVPTAPRRARRHHFRRVIRASETHCRASNGGLRFQRKLLPPLACQSVSRISLRPLRAISCGFRWRLKATFGGADLNSVRLEQWFTSLDHAKVVIAAWRRDYNDVRPHSSIGNRTPAHFAMTM
jgi:transposase InsO family protein